MGQYDQASLSRLSYLRYGRSPHRATVSATYGRLCPGAFPGRSVCAAGKEEVQLIGGFTHRGDRVVPMSEALKDGDQVVVTAGPLLGHEGLIKTINRRKCTAYLELDLCGRRVTTRVGLAVLSNEQRTMRNLKGNRLAAGDFRKGQGGSPTRGRNFGRECVR